MTRVSKVLLVCLHGSAKSVIAAEHLNRLAAGRGIEVRAMSAGMEPDAEIPPHVVRGLLADGIDVSGKQPRRVTPDMVRDSDWVVSFGCQLGDAAPAQGRLIYWDDVPPVSEGYSASRSLIVDHLQHLLDEIKSEQ